MRQRTTARGIPARPRASVRAAADNSAEIFIYDFIDDWGVKAADLVPQIAALKVDLITVRINSPGGNVFDGVAIYNALRQHSARVVVQIDAMAASIATLIALGGDELRMASNALFMIHDPSAITMGTATDHRKTADLLDAVGDTTLVRAYTGKTGQTPETIRDWMHEETWFTAEEADEAGFIDVIIDPSTVKADFDLSIFRHPPTDLAARATTPTTRDLERALRDAGLSQAAAKAVLAQGAHALQRDAGVTGPRDAESEMLAACARLVTTLTPRN